MKLVADSPKTMQIADFLGDKITSGKLKPGRRLQSIRGLAKQFKVSNKVVECALIDLANRGLVEKYVGRGTFVRENIPKQKKTKVKKIALISYFKSEKFESYFDTLSEELDSAGHAFLYSYYNNSVNPFAEQSLKNLLSLEPDAFILDFPGVGEYNKLKPKFKEKPVCLVHQQQTINTFDCPAFFIDKINMYAKAMEFLFDKGHRRIITLGHSGKPGKVPMLTSEYKYLHEAAKMFDMEFDSFNLPYACYKDVSDNPEKLERLFLSENPPTAVIGMSDHIVFCFLEELKEKFPKFQLEAVGAYNTTWSKIPGKHFHTFDMNFSLMWAQAIQHLASPVAKEKVVNWIQPKLICV